MKTSDSHQHQQWIDDRIEAYLDGELPAQEHDLFEQRLAAAEAWQQELSWAITIRDELRAISTPACPPHVKQAVLKDAQREAWTSFGRRLQAGFTGLFLDWRPALATLTLLIVAAVVVSTFNRQSIPAPEPEAISQAEVDQALVEAKWALGYVSKTGRLTGTSVQDALAPFLNDLPKE